MKHLLNDLSSEEKNNIRKQHTGGKQIDTSRFKTLLESKSGDVKLVLTEGAKEYINIPKSGCETYKKGCDPYSYLKVVDGANIKYYFKKNQDTTWVQSKNATGTASIQKNVAFNTNPEEQSKLNPQPINQNNSKVVVGNKMKIKDEKIINGTYTNEELIAIVNGWVPTYDFNLQGSNEQNKKLDDWKKNVDKTNNTIYIWRNNKRIKILEKYKENTPKEVNATAQLYYLVQLISEKLDNEYKKRWEGIA